MTDTLDTVAAPWQVPQVLRRAAEKMREDGAELDGSWQDARAGGGWRVIARELDRAADRIERKLAARGLGESR